MGCHVLVSALHAPHSKCFFLVACKMFETWLTTIKNSYHWLTHEEIWQHFLENNLEAFHKLIYVAGSRQLQQRYLYDNCPCRKLSAFLSWDVSSKLTVINAPSMTPGPSRNLTAFLANHMMHVADCGRCLQFYDNWARQKSDNKSCSSLAAAICVLTVDKYSVYVCVPVTFSVLLLETGLGVYFMLSCVWFSVSLIIS